MDEKQLVQRAQNGDGDAFNRLVEKYQMKMFHLAYGMTRSRETADDLTQEVFLKAYSSLPKFRLESQFGTWLYRIAVNTVKDYVRKEGKAKTYSFDEAVHNVPEQEDAVLKKEQENEEAGMRRMLRQAIEELPEKYRLILTMRDIQGIPYGEIAEVLRISPGTVDSRLFRARKQLKKQLNRLLITRGRES